MSVLSSPVPPNDRGSGGGDKGRKTLNDHMSTTEAKDVEQPTAEPLACNRLLGQADRKQLREGKCPQCSSPNLIEGPRGGLAVNTLCPACGAEFNVGPNAWIAESLGPCPIERQREFYCVSA